MKFFTYIFFLFLVSCVEHNEVYEQSDAFVNDQFIEAVETKIEKSIEAADLGMEVDACIEQWMCWNRDSKFHNKPCQPGCM